MINTEKARDLAKRRLWRNGIKARDVSGTAGYDLLVEGRWQAKVVVAQDLEGFAVKASNCDLMIAVLQDGLQAYAFARGRRGKYRVFDAWITLKELGDVVGSATT